MFSQVCLSVHGGSSSVNLVTVSFQVPGPFLGAGYTQGGRVYWDRIENLNVKVSRDRVSRGLGYMSPRVDSTAAVSTHPAGIFLTIFVTVLFQINF